jgi:hypothetical protein
LGRPETGRRVCHARQTLGSLLAVVERTDDWPIMGRLSISGPWVSLMIPGSIIVPGRRAIRTIAALLRRESRRLVIRSKREVPAIAICVAGPISTGPSRFARSIIGRLARHPEPKGRAFPRKVIAILSSRRRRWRFSRVPVWRVGKWVLKSTRRRLLSGAISSAVVSTRRRSSSGAVFGSAPVLWVLRCAFWSRHCFSDGRKVDNV